MTISTATTNLLNAVTTATTGTALAASGIAGETHAISVNITSLSNWTAQIAIQTDITSVGTWTTQKLWTLQGGTNGFTDVYSLTLATGQSVRGVLLSVTGTTTTVTMADIVITGNNSVAQNAPYVPPGGQTSIPVVLAPNGTIATNGIVTLGTALPATYANAWVYFPASAVVGGSAGLYFTQFTSTTAGQVTTSYHAAATAFTPTIPATLVNAVGSNAAYTQTTASPLKLANVTIPAGSIGPNGQLNIYPVWTINSTAGAKVKAIVLASTSVYSVSATTSTINTIPVQINNRGAQNSQISTSTNGYALASVTAIYSTVDTSANQALTFTGQIAVATDFIVLEAFSVEITPA